MKILELFAEIRWLGRTLAFAGKGAQHLVLRRGRSPRRRAFGSTAVAIVHPPSMLFKSSRH